MDQMVEVVTGLLLGFGLGLLAAALTAAAAWVAAIIIIGIRDMWRD